MLIHENSKRLVLQVGQRRAILLLLAVAWMVIWTLILWAKPIDAVPYPAGYRHWVHVKSMYVGPQNPAFERNGGLHHIYANEKAMEGYRTDKFPDGSVIVADFFEPRENAGVTTEGPRRRIDVMVKDSKLYAETGGWGFEQFRGDSQTDRMVTPQIITKCVECHSQQKNHDYVFSTFRK